MTEPCLRISLDGTARVVEDVFFLDVAQGVALSITANSSELWKRVCADTGIDPEMVGLNGQRVVMLLIFPDIPMSKEAS